MKAIANPIALGSSVRSVSAVSANSDPINSMCPLLRLRLRRRCPRRRVSEPRDELAPLHLRPPEICGKPIGIRDALERVLMAAHGPNRRLEPARTWSRTLAWRTRRCARQLVAIDPGCVKIAKLNLRLEVSSQYCEYQNTKILVTTVNIRQ